MPYKSFEEFKQSGADSISTYQELKLSYPGFDFVELDRIFEITLSKKSLFPSINLPTSSSIENYLSKWVKKYVDASCSLPSKRVAKPKNACDDPAIMAIIQFSGILPVELINEGMRNHNIFMSAENIQGNLLEEFISQEILRFGWLWCKGNILRSIDFCNYNGSVLLQIKNKSNTENSSSSKVRDGTEIEKWYRLGTRTRGGVIRPYFRWDELNVIINKGADSQNIEKCEIQESQYIEFIENTVSRNRRIITDR